MDLNKPIWKVSGNKIWWIEDVFDALAEWLDQIPPEYEFPDGYTECAGYARGSCKKI
jgi:hypothetical protein